MAVSTLSCRRHTQKVDMVTLLATMATTLAVTLANMRTALEALGGEQAGWVEPDRRHDPHLPCLQLGAGHG